MSDLDFGNEAKDCICEGVLSRLYGGTLSGLAVAERARARHTIRYERALRRLANATKQEPMTVRYHE